MLPHLTFPSSVKLHLRVESKHDKNMTKKSEKIEMRYGLWRSPMPLDELLSQPSAPMYPFRWRGKLHYLESLTEQGGRIALMRQTDDARECLTPAPFNIRTNAHEYGGGCFCLLGDEIIFNNFSDGRLYRQDLSATNVPTAMTPLPPQGQTACFADLVALDRLGLVIAVMESGASGREERDYVVAIDGASAASRTGRAAPQVLLEGADFYACAALSPNQTQIAWMEWDNPFMPWDQSRLLRAELFAADGFLEIRKRQVLVERAEQAVCQIGFIDDHRLLFASDSSDNDCWNFFCHKDNEIKLITDDEYEYGEAHWQFGQRRWHGISANKIIAVGTYHAGDCLIEIEIDSGKSTRLADGFATCAHVRAEVAERELLFIAHYAERDAQIRALSFSKDDAYADDRVLHASTSGIAEHGCSVPQCIAYPTRDGRQAHAYFYAPHNSNYRAPHATKPPLLVMVHGGPTGRATPELHPLKQFFTSLGYAVLDINHRGSTGYGRAYRQSLLGQWGEIDAMDIADGVHYAVEKNWVDPELIFIRGGSAGGYAVLRALTRFPKMFCGGACYYGIGNLITLAKITHKFEGYYSDRLIGEKFDPNKVYDPIRDSASRFIARSPIFQLDHLNSPLILFQGLEDKVVPPALSREVAELLNKKGILYEYVEYADEGHGFRRLPNRVDSLKKETAFFASIIRAKTAQSGESR